MTPPLPPEQNIGPYYKALGLFLCLVFGALLLIGRWRGEPLTKYDLIMAGIVIGALLAVVRPNLFDRFMRWVAAALPFTKYGRPSGDTGQVPASRKPPEGAAPGRRASDRVETPPEGVAG